MTERKTTVQLSKEGLKKLNTLAKLYRRTTTGQLEWMIEQWQSGLDKMGVVRLEADQYTLTTTLPRPDGAQVVPVVTVKEQE